MQTLWKVLLWMFFILVSPFGLALLLLMVVVGGPFLFVMETASHGWDPAEGLDSTLTELDDLLGISKLYDRVQDWRDSRRS